MANYANLKAQIDANIFQNDQSAITGAIMNAQLKAMVDALGAGYQYMGVATPSTNPGTPDQKVFYLASQPGTYTNFLDSSSNALVVNDGEVCALVFGTAWSKQVTGAATAEKVNQLDQKLIYQIGLLPRAMYLCNCSRINIDFNSTIGKHELIIAHDSIVVYYNGTKQMSTASDLTLTLSYTYNLICYDSTQNTFVNVNYQNVTSLQDGLFFAALVVPSYSLLYSDLPISLDGRAYNIPIASDSVNGLLSKEDKALLVPATALSNGLLSSSDKAKIDQLTIDPYDTIPVVAASDGFRFIKENNTWYFRAEAGVANFPTLGTSGKNNAACDINLSSLSGWIKILVDNNGNLSAVSKTASHANKHVLFIWYVGIESIMYFTAPYLMNGRYCGIKLATNEDNGLMSKEDKAKLDSLINPAFVYDFQANYPIIPNDLFVLDDAPTLLYKKSMILDPFNGDVGCDMILTTTVNSRHRSLSIQEPINICSDDIGDTARITVAKNTDITTNVFKDVAIHKASVQSKSGHTPKILMIGDSITHGDNGAQSSPIVKINELLPSRYNVTPIMIGTFAPFSVPGEGRGCFNFEAMAGVENNPFDGRFHFPSVGGTLEAATSKTTTQFQNPFTFPATANDLSIHPEWCFTNSNNYSDEDDGVSYAEATAEQKANWHFFTFDFDRYVHIWGDENHKPDIITIALGTNDWWPSYQIRMTKVLLAIDIIYAKIREALPNVKIAFVSAQNIATTFQNDSSGNWETEIAPLILNIQKKIATWKAGGDANVFELPIYACGSRWLAFDGYTAGTPSALSEINTVQKETIDANVHLLDGVGSDGYWEYMDCILTALAFLS